MIELLASATAASTTAALFFRWRWKLAERSRERWRMLAWRAMEMGSVDHCDVMFAEMVDNGHADEPKGKQ